MACHILIGSNFSFEVVRAVTLPVTINDPLDLLKYGKRTFAVAEIAPCVRVLSL